jgi:hypothetical protein
MIDANSLAIRRERDLLRRKPLTIDAWEGFRTSDFDGRVKSGTGEYGPTVSLIRFLPKAHPFGSHLCRSHPRGSIPELEIDPVQESCPR